jgi:ABC-2 type transport system ATP-binding protein
VNLSLYLTVAEVLDLYHAVYGAGWPQLADALDIGQLLALRARTLSRGQRQRLDLYTALAHRPALIMLDEPLAGLDRAYIDLVTNVLRGPELAHAALLIVGHTDDEFALMDQVALVHDGGVDAPMPPVPMVERHLARYRLRIDMAGSADADRIEARARAHGQVRRVVRHSETGISAFSERLLDADAIDPEGARWLSCETGLTTLEHVIRFGPATGGNR